MTIMPKPNGAVDEALSLLSSTTIPFKVDGRLVAHLVGRDPRLVAEATDFGWNSIVVRDHLMDLLADVLLARPFHRYAFHKIGVAADQENRRAFFTDLRRAHDEWVRRHG